MYLFFSLAQGEENSSRLGASCADTCRSIKGEGGLKRGRGWGCKKMRKKMRSSHLQFYCDTLDLDRRRGRRTEIVEWFIEDQAFLRSYDSAPRPPPLPSTSCLSFSVFKCVFGRAFWQERGEGRMCNKKCQYARKMIKWQRDNCVPASVKKCGKWYGSMWPGVWQTVWQHVVRSGANGMTAWGNECRKCLAAQG